MDLNFCGVNNMSNSRLKLSFATSDYEHVRDVTMGTVEPEGIELIPITLRM